MVYRHVIEMTASTFCDILCVFVNFVGFCSSATERNIRSPGIHARLGTMPSKCPRRSKTSHILSVSRIQTCLNMRSTSFNTGKPILYNFFYGDYFLLAVMVEGDESSRLRMANQRVVLGGYQPLLTALCNVSLGHLWLEKLA